MKVTYIPAAPGFNVVEYIHARNDSEGKGETFRTPIIAWQIRHEDDDELQPYIYAVTVDGVDDDNETDILYPDGQVCRPMSHTISSLDAWEQDQIQQEEKQQITTMEGLRKRLGMNKEEGT
jgi:hypothetical protein